LANDAPPAGTWNRNAAFRFGVKVRHETSSASLINRKPRPRGASFLAAESPVPLRPPLAVPSLVVSGLHLNVDPRYAFHWKSEEDVK
jgi:hypothetical protein